MSKSPTDRRLDALRARLAEEEADALLVASETNVSYLTGFTGDASALIVTSGRVVAVTDGRYGEQFAQECPGLEVHVRPIGQPLMTGLAEVAGRLDLSGLAFEASHLSVAQHDAFREAAPSLATRGVSGWVETLRMVKDADEIAAIRASIAIAERAFVQIAGEVRPGTSEKALADDLEFAMRRLGATAAAFPTIVAVGARAALPHARPSDSARVGDGDFVLFDWGASGRPYRSDLTRMVVLGNFASKFEAVYRAVLEAQRRAIAAIRPGVTGKAIDAEARSALHDAGLAEFFTHSTGHGIGRDIHEMPFLGRDPDVPLRPGMVVTIEPGVYLPDWGGIRIEDDVLVTPEGPEVLTSLPRDLGSVRLRA